jgi:hypothetical protein
MYYTSLFLSQLSAQFRDNKYLNFFMIFLSKNDMLFKQTSSKKRQLFAMLLVAKNSQTFMFCKVFYLGQSYGLEKGKNIYKH